MVQPDPALDFALIWFIMVTPTLLVFESEFKRIHQDHRKQSSIFRYCARGCRYLNDIPSGRMVIMAMLWPVTIPWHFIECFLCEISLRERK